MTVDSNVLKLLALDGEDLRIISAHVQDAVMTVGDMRYLKKEKRFVLTMNRFDRQNETESAKNAARKRDHVRRRAVLHFDRVMGVKEKNIKARSPDTVLNLLAVTFNEVNAPAGEVTLVFSGDGAIRLSVECLEARLGDLDAAWSTQHAPDHGRLPELVEEPFEEPTQLERRQQQQQQQ